MIAKEVLDRYNMKTLTEYLEAEDEKVNMELMFYTDLLSNTDHIPLKIFEKFIEDMAEASLTETIGVIINFFKDIKITYAQVLSARKIAREEINRLKAEAEA